MCQKCEVGRTSVVNIHTSYTDLIAYNDETLDPSLSFWDTLYNIWTYYSVLHKLHDTLFFYTVSVF